MTKPNKFDGKCCSCGCYVPAGEGLVHSREGKRDFRRWITHTNDGRSVGWTHKITCKAHANDVVW